MKVSPVQVNTQSALGMPLTLPKLSQEGSGAKHVKQSQLYEQSLLSPARALITRDEILNVMSPNQKMYKDRY